MTVGDEHTDLGLEASHPMIAVGSANVEPPHPALDVERAQVFGALFGETPLRRFGRYIVLGMLGQGGMGTVLKGYDEKLDRKVAIKVLHADPSGRRGLRLRREAQALAKLGHPNVVQVFEVSEAADQLFVVMELVKGQTLRQWQREAHDWKECVRVYLQAGQGLAAAHAKGLIHRDFKPGNAILDEEGRTRVLDFGLARRGDEEDDYGDEVSDIPSAVQRARTERSQLPPFDQVLTRTGAVIGTPAYMPPEQMSGKVTDARGDQFSFCVSLYEALYGERPYGGDTIVAMMVAMRCGEIRPVPGGSTVPAKLRKVVLRGLAVEPAERWPSMEDLLNELQALVAPRASRWLGGVGLTMAVAASIAGVMAWQQSEQATAKDMVITETREELAQRVAQLEAERRRTNIQLAAQKGLRAKDISENRGRALEAVRVAVEAAGDLDAQAGPIPPAVFDGLTYALAGLHGGFTLRGHMGMVHGVANSPDGRHIATASDDATVRLWDAHSGASVRSFEGHQGKVLAVAFSPDGAWLVTAGEDKTVRLWDCLTGQQLDAWKHQYPVYSVAVSPDGRRVAFASGSAAWEWHLGMDDIVVPLSGHADRVRALAYSPVGQRFATASEDGTVLLWNSSTGQVIHRLKGHTDKVLAVAFSVDGTRLATGSRDQTARVWDTLTGTLEDTFELHEVVYAVALSPDGTQLATGTFDDGRAHLWDTATGRRLDTFRHEDAVSSVSFSPDGRRLITGSWDFTARTWDLGREHLDPHQALVALKHDRRVDAVARSADGARIATGSGDGSVRLWEAGSGFLLATLRGHVLDVLDVAFTPDGQRLATASWDGSVRVWGARSGTLLQTFIDHDEPVRAMVFSLSGNRLITASRDGTARVWDVNAGARRHTLVHGKPLVDVVLSPEGEHLVTVGADDTVKVWSMASGETIAGLLIESPVTAVAFSPDGASLAIAGKGNEVRLSSTSTGEELSTFAGHLAPVTEVVFSSDGALLATASEDGTARVWETATGTQRVALPHHSSVNQVVFSADGSRLVTVNGDTQARVWSLQPEAWLLWGCAMLADRHGHSNMTREACSNAAAGEPPATPVTRPPPEPTVVTPEAARPEPESITVHGVELVLIPGGTFTMGAPNNEAGSEVDEWPQHEVTLDSFYLAKTPVTNAQYALFLEANPEVAEPPGWHERYQDREGQPNQPVIALTWYEAKAYCDWAGLVLPTEAQWEYAARATTTTVYWFGNEPEDLRRFAWFSRNTGNEERAGLGARAHAVATKGPNPFGLYDMHGNTWEWTRDAYGPYTTEVREGDGLRNRPIGSAYRAIRGGAWESSASSTRAADRYYFAPDYQLRVVGLRPALSFSP